VEEDFARLPEFIKNAEKAPAAPLEETPDEESKAEQLSLF
jgi:hypothetical protein